MSCVALQSDQRQISRGTAMPERRVTDRDARDMAADPHTLQQSPNPVYCPAMLKLLFRVFVGLLAGIGVLSVAAVIWLVSGGMSSRRTPGTAETWLAQRMRSFAISAADRQMTDPEPESPVALRIGLEQFADHCATCHGNDGAGKVDIARGLYPRPPDLRGRPTQAMTDGEILHIINSGVRFTGMPAWDHEPRESWALVRFIRHLPDLTKAESDRMKALNPKGAGEAAQAHAK